MLLRLFEKKKLAPNKEIQPSRVLEREKETERERAERDTYTQSGLGSGDREKARERGG